MQNEILNLEGVQTLSKEQMKNVKGEGIRVRDIAGTGRLLPDGRMECTWRWRNTFLGIGYGEWTYTSGACPEGHGGDEFTAVLTES
jgi:hypothetical protein